jgi:hypothetical protein
MHLQDFCSINDVHEVGHAAFQCMPVFAEVLCSTQLALAVATGRMTGTSSNSSSSSSSHLLQPQQLLLQLQSTFRLLNPATTTSQALMIPLCHNQCQCMSAPLVLQASRSQAQEVLVQHPA